MTSGLMIDEDTMKLILDYNDKVDELLKVIDEQHKIIADITDLLHNYLASQSKLIKEMEKTPRELRTN